MKIYDITLTFTPVLVGENVPDNDTKCSSAEKVVTYMRGAFDVNPEAESFWVIPLNRKNYAKGRHCITTGTATSALAHPREVLRTCILATATGFVCVHNHPSGDPAPSAADLQVTRQLREAAKAVDIEFLDHVIIGDASLDPMGRGFYSFREAGLI